MCYLRPGPHSDMQGGVTSVVGHVDARLPLQQQLHHLSVARPYRAHQWRVARLRISYGNFRFVNVPPYVLLYSFANQMSIPCRESNVKPRRRVAFVCYKNTKTTS